MVMTCRHLNICFDSNSDVCAFASCVKVNGLDHKLILVLLDYRITWRFRQLSLGNVNWPLDGEVLCSFFSIQIQRFQNPQSMKQTTRTSQKCSDVYPHYHNSFWSDISSQECFSNEKAIVNGHLNARCAHPERSCPDPYLHVSCHTAEPFIFLSNVHFYERQ